MVYLTERVFAPAIICLLDWFIDPWLLVDIDLFVLLYFLFCQSYNPICTLKDTSLLFMNGDIFPTTCYCVPQLESVAAGLIGGFINSLPLQKISDTSWCLITNRYWHVLLLYFFFLADG